MNYTIVSSDAVKKPVFRQETIDMYKMPGGFLLSLTELKTGTSQIDRGTPVSLNWTTRIATIVKTALVVAGSTTTVTRVAKNHQFKVGDVISKTVGAIGVAITAISTSNSDYDTLTHLTNGGAWSDGDVLFQATAVGATSTELRSADALTIYDAITLNRTNVNVDVLTGGVIEKEANLPYSLHSTNKTSLTSRFYYAQ